MKPIRPSQIVVGDTVSFDEKGTVLIGVVTASVISRRAAHYTVEVGSDVFVASFAKITDWERKPD